MKRIMLGALLFLVVMCTGFTTVAAGGSPDIEARQFTLPGPPAFFMRELRERENAPLEVALVFGRATGCQNADPDFINLVAREAIRARLNPKILAATIAVESECTQMAISTRGAIGYTQVVPRVWKDKFDFARDYNLFNAQDNVHVGAVIMAGLVREHGLATGVQLYNGAGVGCSTCDGNYSNKIVTLAGR